MFLALARVSSVARVVPPLARVLTPAIAGFATTSQTQWGHNSKGRTTFRTQRTPKRNDAGERATNFFKDRDAPPHRDRPSRDDRSRGRDGEHRATAPAGQTTSRRLAEVPSSPRNPVTPQAEVGGKTSAAAAAALGGIRSHENVVLAQPKPFATFDLHPGLLSALEERMPGGQTTAIQSLSLAKLLASPKGKQIRAVLGAETGSGKTLAYLLPLLHHLKATDMGPPPELVEDAKVAPRALILAPTHELTRQSTSVAKSLTHEAKLTITGASSPGSVRAKGPVDVLFATGRSAASLLGLPFEERAKIGRPTRREIPKDEGEEEKKREREPEVLLDLSRSEWLVIDEADVLLGPDFLPETSKVVELVRAASPGVHVLLVTATLPPSLLRALESGLFGQVEVKVKAKAKVDVEAKAETDAQTEDEPEDVDIETQTVTKAMAKAEPKDKSKPRNLEFEHLLSPGLHRLPKQLDTRFVPWSGGGNRLADVVHEVKRGFAEDVHDAKLAAGEEGVVARPRAVVFCGSVGQVKAISAALAEKEVPALAWTGDSPERNERPGHNGPLDAFLVQHKRASPDTPTRPEHQAKDKTPRVLVTTSLLSRGLDFSAEVASIYLVDPPRNVLDFVHRAGRAGRAGRHGRVVVFGVSGVNDLKYGKEIKSVLGKTERRAAVKPGGRTFSGARDAARGGSSGGGGFGVGAGGGYGGSVGGGFRAPERGERGERSFGDRAERAERGERSFGGRSGGKGERGERSFGDRSGGRGGDSFSGDHASGERWPLDRASGERRSYNREGGERRFGGDRGFGGDRVGRAVGERKPFDRVGGERTFGGERKFGGDRGDRASGERGFRRDGERGDPSFGGERSGSRSFGERSGGNRPFGGNRPLGDRSGSWGGEREPTTRGERGGWGGDRGGKRQGGSRQGGGFSRDR